MTASCQTLTDLDMQHTNNDTADCPRLIGMDTNVPKFNHLRIN